MTVHVYPVDDIREHNTDGIDCDCDPRIEWVDPDTCLPWSEDGQLVIHNSYDNREQHEIQEPDND